ncbi:MAG: phosphoglyceromutase [Mucilaginibacter sp.]|nr:phosphoglyceromutase [Mucilaginibacter sp.]
MKKLALFIIALGMFLQLKAQNTKTQNIIIVTLDGFRWQELYRGADSALINSKFNSDKEGITKKFWAPTAQERRKLLLPFFLECNSRKRTAVWRQGPGEQG